MLKYNTKVMEELMQTLHLTSLRELLMALQEIGIGISMRTLDKWIKDGCIPMDHVFTICNKFHFPFARFIISDSADTFVICTGNAVKTWIDIRFNSEEFYQLIKTITTYEERSMCMGLKNKLTELNAGNYESLLKIPLNVMLDFCSKNDICIGDLIIDENESLPFDSSMHHRTQQGNLNFMNGIKSMHAHSVEQEQKCKRHEEALARTTVEMAVLTQENKELKCKVASMNHEKVKEMTKENKKK